MRLFDWFQKPRSNVPRPMPPERLEEIDTWLQHPISVVDALAKMGDYDWAMNGVDLPDVRSLQTWIEDQMQPGDELWWYDTVDDSWENLCGENGFALLRGGKVSSSTCG